MSVIVKQGSSQGSFVSDASVTMTSDRGNEIVLPWVGFLGMGSYSKSNFVWEPGWKLKIVRGTDRLEAYLHAPGVTTILEPTPNSTFNRADGMPLVVRWKDESGRGAQSFQIEVKRADYNQARPDDPGLFQLPTTRLVPSNDEAITVERTNEVKLNGGVPGSTFQAFSKAEVKFTVQ